MPCAELKATLQAENKSKCFDTSSVAKEGGKRFAFDNVGKRDICRVRVDDCLITEQQPKCDFLFKVFSPNKYYLVELKGININDGIVQIVNTFEIINRKILATPADYCGIIVSSGVPRAAQQRFRKLQEKCYKEKKLLIKKTHFQHIEKI